MFGGVYADTLNGGGDDNILFNETATFGTNAATIDALLTFWDSGLDYTDRVNDLRSGTTGVAVLPLAVVDRAFALRRAWRGHRLSGDALTEHGLALSCELERLAWGHFTHEPNRRLAKHLLNHPMQWFWFLIDPTIAATNYRAEQAIRPAVVNRKVWGGNRTWLGARAQGTMMSVIRTCGQRDIDPFAFLSDVLCRPQPQLILN